MKKLSLFLKFLATGSISLMLTACYGTMVAMYGMPVVHRTGSFKIIDSVTGSPIPGIKVTYYDQEESVDYSNVQGIVEYDLFTMDYEGMPAFLSDIDGSSNGRYQEITEEELDGDDGTIDEITLTELDSTD